MSWYVKHKPQTLDEVVLPTDLVKKLTRIKQRTDKPNLLLQGPPGTGKSSTAFLMSENPLKLNGGNLNTSQLEKELTSYCPSISIYGEEKCVVIDEVDALAKDAKESLRALMDEFGSVCSFIFTTNNLNKVSEPIKSRTMIFNYTFDAGDIELFRNFTVRCTNILKKEDIDYDENAIAALVRKSFPHFRAVINDLESAYG